MVELEPQASERETELMEAAVFRLRLPAPAVLTPAEELALMRLAHLRDPGSLEFCCSLASELLRADLFEEAIALLEQWQQAAGHTQRPRFQLLLTEALRSRDTTQANERICEICNAALAAGPSALRTELLATLGRAQIKLGLLDEARASLAAALASSPHDRNAYKRVATLKLDQGEAQAVLEDAEDLYAAGVTHSRVIASQALAFAQLGWMEKARAVAGLDQFLVKLYPPPPPGWATLAGFCADLAPEIRDHPGQRASGYGVASTKTMRVDKPELHRSRLVPVLQRLIQREVEAYVARLASGPSDHPFLQGRPSRGLLRNWCVITEGEGHEEWHVHQNGWLSGVFYLQVPDHIAQGTGPGGCISFGLPEEIVGRTAAAAFGERIIRPRTGLMMLFPSHSYHRTYAHAGPGKRICYAFDVVPEAAH